jgi:hypothetical protein
MQPCAAVICSAAAVTPTLPTSRAYNCAITTHSGAGLYEVTLDEGIDATECVVAGSCIGVDGSFAVVHVSDTVKRIVTYLAGVLDDTVEFSAVFYRLPAGHPAA